MSVTGPITGDGAKLRGFEVAYQQFFDALPEPWNGLGVQANYTYVDNQGITNSNLMTVSGSGTVQQDPLITFTDLPLEGYSPNSYNLVFMFERPKFGARLAWNWRDDYLISQSDCCIKLPIWQDAYGQLDGSVHFRPDENWDIFLDAQNLLQEETVLQAAGQQSGSEAVAFLVHERSPHRRSAFAIASSKAHVPQKLGAPYTIRRALFFQQDPRVRQPLKIVIVGGGTAGWMTAAAFAAVFRPEHRQIRLIESSEIGIVGVGEATLPHIRFFNRRIGIDERELMAKTQATFKLGIEFVNWARIGDSYIHPFGAYGSRIAGVPFHNYWLRSSAPEGTDASIEDYSLPIVASRLNRFAMPSEDPTVGDVHLRLRLPVRRFAVRAVPARLRRETRRAAHRRQDRRREAARRGRLGGVGEARQRRDGQRATCSSTARAFAAC